jgi:hypothetical protein
MDRGAMPRYDVPMESGIVTAQGEASVTPRRMVPLRTVLILAAAIIVVVIVAGFVHVVHGAGVGVALCRKDYWGLDNTVVSLDDYVDRPILTFVDKDKVLRAMFACGTLTAPRPGPRSFGNVVRRGSKVNATKVKLAWYAYEAYPSWAAGHPNEMCPHRLRDLNDSMNPSDLDDAWGRPLKMLCGGELPQGAKGFAVLSWGEDGKEGTADDLKSWEIGAWD